MSYLISASLMRAEIVSLVYCWSAHLQQKAQHTPGSWETLVKIPELFKINLAMNVFVGSYSPSLYEKILFHVSEQPRGLRCQTQENIVPNVQINFLGFQALQNLPSLLDP